MADTPGGQERTEQATAKRLEEARKKGQVPRSRELSTTLILLSVAVVLWATSGTLAQRLGNLMRGSFNLAHARDADPSVLFGNLAAVVSDALIAVAPILLVTVVAALVASFAFGGVGFGEESLAFKWERLDPIQGLARLWSLRSVVEVAKALAKFLLLLGCGVAVLYGELDAIRGLGRVSLPRGLTGGLDLTLWAFSMLTVGTVLIAVIDVPYQWWEHRRMLRMSRQELREELRESEGSPEVKQRVRAMQQQLASRRMMEDVPRADVVITNPTHYAVALRFDPATMNAPRVVAKGSDHVAFRIRDLARSHGVTIVAAPPLARAVFHSTKIGREIPAGLYVAVAQVLAYVFQLRRRSPGAPQPVLPADLPIPPELQY